MLTLNFVIIIKLSGKLYRNDPKFSDRQVEANSLIGAV